jgi:hypothetical protein
MEEPSGSPSHANELILISEWSATFENIMESSMAEASNKNSLFFHRCLEHHLWLFNLYKP